MNPFYILDTIKLKEGVHHSFKCVDCHSNDYQTYPHNAELKFEPLMTCIDCHGGDKNFADYQFEKIEEEFKKGIHYKKIGDNYTCSKCHDQHYYKITTRKSHAIKEIVVYNNRMCLSCHDNMVKIHLYIDENIPSIKQIHNWLPNQTLHFENVRCVECHSQIPDSLLVPHNISPKEKAVRNCAKCHSSNTLLIASLYKYQNLQERGGEGKVNTILKNQSYVIGAGKNPFLKMLSIFFFILSLVGILIHIIFRIIRKK